MPKRRTDLKPDKNGRYFRQLGWKISQDFTTRLQPKFYLGRVLEVAQFAYHRLGLLWDAIVANPINDMEAHWTDQTLVIAELVREGKMEYELPTGPLVSGVPFNIVPIAYTREVLDLRKRFGHVISIVPADPDFFRLGQSGIATIATDHVRAADVFARQAEVTIPRTSNEKTLFEAIDAYAAYAPKANTKEHGLKEAERAQCIKSAIEDLPLSPKRSRTEPVGRA